MIGALLGGLILGFAPSTVALYTVTRKTALGEDTSIFRLFAQTYRKDFWKANLLGYVLAGFGILWFIDFRLALQMEGIISLILQCFLLLIGIVYLILLIYIFPVYVHYQLKYWQYFKYAIAFGFLQPANFILMLFVMAGTYYFLAYLQGFIAILGFSLTAQLNMWIAFQLFKKVESMGNRHIWRTRTE